MRNRGNEKFLKEYYSAMIGGTITSVGFTAGDEYTEPFPYFTIRMKGGVTYTVEISQDEEGNGPGFLFGLPVPEGSKGNGDCE